MDWSHYGVAPPLTAVSARDDSVARAAAPAQTVDKWVVRSSHKVFEVVGKMAAWGAAEYRFERGNPGGVGLVTWAGEPRNHGADVFPKMRLS